MPNAKGKPDSERITVRIESHPPKGLEGLDLLPDVLRQLNAMVRLLTEFASDPRVSRVEVISLAKQSPLEASLRVVTIREQAKQVKGKPPRKPTIRPTSQPIRRLERAYAQATGIRQTKNLDATGLSVLADVAKLLRHDVAVIETAQEHLRIDSALLRQIDTKLGVVHRSRGSVTGILEGLNVHSRPWSFTVYPQIGPTRIRCTFDESLFAAVQSGIRQVVRVQGLKDYVGDHPWPVRMHATKLTVLDEAPEGHWLVLAETLSRLWDEASEDERLIISQEQAI